MKKNIRRSAVSLVVLGMTVSGTAGVYAGSNLQKITAYLNHGVGITVNGSDFTAIDGHGNKQLPITYQDTTYLPVRSIADALHVPIVYDGKNNQISIGTVPAANDDLADVTFSTAQVETIKKEFAKFESFETAYAPKQTVKGDAYLQAAATGDGVNLVFGHMIVNVSPRDYSDGYDSKTVSLSNGTKAKWYTPGDIAMLSFKLDDRIITISSPDHTLSSAQIENVAVTVAKLQ